MPKLFIQFNLLGLVNLTVLQKNMWYQSKWGVGTTWIGRLRSHAFKYEVFLVKKPTENEKYTSKNLALKKTPQQHLKGFIFWVYLGRRFPVLLCFKIWRDGRVVECAGLLNR